MWQPTDTSIHVRAGGAGPAVVLLHGYGETGDMWVPLASDLTRDHTVVVPDLRGLGLSSKPPDGFDKKTQAGDVAHPQRSTVTTYSQPSRSRWK
jgi:pimeloyl-ACP methyl ester carboxylesterase